MSDQRHKDSWATTLKRIPWRRLVADATLELVASGTGFAISPIATPAGALATEKAVKRVLEYMLRRFAHVYESGEVTLSEIVGRMIPDARYASVADFWAKITHSKLDTGALIEISGLLSPYGPLMPAHPMSRPGYTIEGWLTMGDLGAKDTEEYDARDGFIYGDRVIRLSRPRQNKYYAGLYDAYFGIANVSLPLYVDDKLLKSPKHGLSDLWKYSMIPGRIVKIKGRLRRITNYYAQFAGQLPAEYCTLPSFGLEVFTIETSRTPDSVTHISATVSWKRRAEERMITHYFNMQDKRQFNVAEQVLEEVRKKHKSHLLFNYDDVACLSPQWRYKLPQYNEMIKPWLEGQSL